MSNGRNTADTERPNRSDLSAEELESMGLSHTALEAAIGRAKLRTVLKQRQQRPKLHSNPELDEWFD